MTIPNVVEMNPWLYVELPYAAFAIEIQNGFVVKVPPIAQWMINKDLNSVLSWILDKGGKYEPLD